MSVGAICFTSSSSNGGCWVVLVFFLGKHFFLKKGFFFHWQCTPPGGYAKKVFPRLTPKKKQLW